MATLLSGRAMDDKPVAPASPWQPWYPDGQQRFLLMAVILDVGTKPLQRHVPTRRNLLEIIAEFCELLRLNLPQAVSPTRSLRTRPTSSAIPDGATFRSTERCPLWS